jgi:hypothetical protein
VADIKISQLAEASECLPTDYLMLVQSGVNKKVTLTTLLKNLVSQDTIRLNPTQLPLVIRLSSMNKPYLFNLDGINDRIGINTQSPQDLFHVNGNVQVGATDADGLFTSSYELIYAKPSPYINTGTDTTLVNFPISPARESTGLSVFGACTYILGNGYEGQTKNIYLSAIISSGDAVISVAQGLGFTSIQLTATGKGLTLKYINSKWICVGNNGAVLT